jgi:hypothetical protein
MLAPRRHPASVRRRVGDASPERGRQAGVRGVGQEREPVPVLSDNYIAPTATTTSPHLGDCGSTG